MLNIPFITSNFFLLEVWSSFFSVQMGFLVTLFKAIVVLSAFAVLIVLSKNTNISCILLLASLFSSNIQLANHSKTNLGLINTLSFWHPVNFTLIGVLLLLRHMNVKVNLTITAVLGFFFIFLGMWWSSQELLWQGWWNWDGVENTMLFLFIYIFVLTHTKLNSFNLYAHVNNFILFFYLHFGVLNKTNLFKSIHSFTSSVYSNMSYNIFIVMVVYYLYLLFCSGNRKSILYYNLLLWIAFYLFLYYTNNVLFGKQFFFYYLNVLFLLLLLYSKSIISVPLSIVIFSTQPYFFSLLICLYIHFRILFFNKHLILHLVVSVTIFWVSQFLTSSHFVYNYLTLIDCVSFHNFVNINGYLTLYRHTFIDRAILNEVTNAFIVKNLTIKSIFTVQNLTIVSLLFKIQIKYTIFYIKILYIFIVTKAYYSKQKPRFKYYILMYVYKPNLLINQQKHRRIPNKISNQHCGSKSISMANQNLFIVSNQLSIDLRLYRFLLRKTKKKLLKLKVCAFVNLIPNNKTSHKSKNSRMGKGKGLNNRFYFRLKNTKPILILRNLSDLRFSKFKKFLFKFLNYKYI